MKHIVLIVKVLSGEVLTDANQLPAQGQVLGSMYDLLVAQAQQSQITGNACDLLKSLSREAAIAVARGYNEKEVSQLVRREPATWAVVIPEDKKPPVGAMVNIRDHFNVESN